MGTSRIFLLLIFLSFCLPVFSADQPSALDSWNELFQDARKQEYADCSRAQSEYQELIKIAGDHQLKSEYVRSLLGACRVQRRCGKPDVEAAQKVMRLAEELNDKRLIAESFIEIGNTLNQRSKYSEANEQFRKALEIGRAEQDVHTIAQAQYGIGIVDFYGGKLPQALVDLQTALESAKESKDQWLVAACLGTIGITFREQGRVEQALDYAGECLKIEEREGFKLTLPNSLANFAIAYKQLGLLDDAIDADKRALDSARAVGNRIVEAQTLNNLGLIYKEEGLYDQALAYLEKALKCADDLGNKRGVALVSNNIGEIYATQSLEERAFSYYEKALMIREETGDKWGVTSTLNNMGALYEARGDYQEAMERYRKAFSIAEAAGDLPRTALATLNLGRVANLQGNYHEAEELLQKSVQTARETKSRKDLGFALQALGSVYLASGRPTEAREALQQALQIGREMNHTEIVWRSAYELGKTYQKLAAVNEALESYALAIEEIESVRTRAVSEEGKAAFLTDKIGVYEDFIAFLVDRGRTAEAFEYAERAKARTLLDAISEAEAGIRSGFTKEQTSTERTALAKISRIQSQLWNEKTSEQERQEKDQELRRAEEEFDRFLLNLRLTNPEYAELEYPEPVRLSEIQPSLDRRTAMIEYFVGEKQSFGFAITSRDCSVHKLPGAREIQQSLRQYVEAISRPPVAGPAGDQTKPIDYQALSRSLYEKLLSPLPPIVFSKGSWILIPDGSLYSLPFESLTQKNGRYVLNDYRITYSPSATIWKRLRSVPDHPNGRKTLLAFADELSSGVVAEERNGFGPLRYAKSEVETVASLFPAGASTVYVNEQASEATLKHLKISDYRLVHFASHAVIDEQTPGRSGLILVPGADGEDGLLQVREIFGLRLNADLVVLSACRTAMGKLMRGEGMMGLMRAFLYAGTRNVLASLWSVDDKSTAELMKYFYESMKTAPKAESLRRAKLRMIEEAQSGHGYAAYAHPYYWSAFTIVGSGF